jgi:hypothetical protein
MNDQKNEDADKEKYQVEFIRTIQETILKETVDSAFPEMSKEQFEIQFEEHPEHNGIYSFTLSSTYEKSCDEILLVVVQNIEEAFKNKNESKYDHVKIQIDAKLDDLKIQMDSLATEYQKEDTSDKKKKLLMDALQSLEMIYSNYLEEKTAIMMSKAGYDRLFYYVERTPRLKK